MLSQRIEQWAEGDLATGRTEGRTEGRKEGRLEGEVSVLVRLLTRRFGPLPAWALARLGTASDVDLEHWTDAVLDAVSLSEILGPPPADH